MRDLPGTIMSLGIAALAALAGLSIFGACIGTDAAGEFFNSTALIIYWCCLAALILASFVFWRSMTRRAGLLVAHVGTVLIILGGLYGSQKFCDYARENMGVARLHGGDMLIPEARAKRPLDLQAVSGVQGDEPDNVDGHLPFALALKRFWIQYHDEDMPWQLGLNAPGVQPGQPRTREALQWQIGKETHAASIDARVTVLQYIHNAARVPGQLKIIGSGGAAQTCQVRPGQTMDLGAAEGVVTIKRVFSHINLIESMEKVYAVNIHGSHGVGALDLELKRPDGTVHRWYVFHGSPPEQPGAPGGLIAAYTPDTFKPAASVDAQPAMEVLIRREGKWVSMWLVGGRNAPSSWLALSGGFMPRNPGVVRADDDHDSHTYMVLARPSSMPKQYFSTLAVIEDGREVAEKTITVNDPLHYGGYSFYYQDWGQDGNWFHTILRVRSDADRWPVFAGICLVCAGVFWLFWIKPVWSYLRKRASQ